MPCCLHRAQTLGIRLSWVAILMGVWLVGPAHTNTWLRCERRCGVCRLGAHEHSCTMTWLHAFPLQCYYLFFSIIILLFSLFLHNHFILFAICQYLYWSFHILCSDGNELVSLHRLHIISLGQGFPTWRPQGTFCRDMEQYEIFLWQIELNFISPTVPKYNLPSHINKL